MATKKQKAEQERLTRFIAYLTETGNIAGACRIAGMSRTTAYSYRDDPEITIVRDNLGDIEIVEFRQAWEEARLEGLENLEQHARDWAMKGIPEVVVYQGKLSTVIDPETGEEVILTVPKISEGLTKFMLEGGMPEKYGKHVTIDATVKSGVIRSPIDPEQTSVEVRVEMAEQQKKFREG